MDSSGSSSFRLTLPADRAGRRLRVVLWGYHDAALAMWDALGRSRWAEIAGIVLPPDRVHQSIAVLQRRARRRGLTVLRPQRPRDAAFLAAHAALAPDLIISAAYTRLIPDAVTAAVHGFGFNLHPGALPRFRGANVLNWAVLEGASETAMTLHQLTAGFDEGPVVAAMAVPIGPRDTAADVHAATLRAVPALIAELGAQLAAGGVTLHAQRGEPNYYRARTPEQGRLDPALGAAVLDRLVRAVSHPWPGAFLEHDGRPITVWRADVVPDLEGTAPGTVSMLAGDVILSTVAGALRIREINRPGAAVYEPVTGPAVAAAFGFVAPAGQPEAA